MAKYLYSYRVPADFAPGAGTPAVWEAWLGGLGDSPVDFGRTVTDSASIGEVGGSESKVVGYSVVSAHDLDGALAMAKGCPALRVGGGIEVGLVMEVPAS